MKVVWDEPDEKGNNIRMERTLDEAVEYVRGYAESRGFPKPEYQRALDEFLITHWAWLEH